MPKELGISQGSRINSSTSCLKHPFDSGGFETELSEGCKL